MVQIAVGESCLFRQIISVPIDVALKRLLRRACPCRYNRPGDVGVLLLTSSAHIRSMHVILLMQGRFPTVGFSPSLAHASRLQHLLNPGEVTTRLHQCSVSTFPWSPNYSYHSDIDVEILERLSVERLVQLTMAPDLHKPISASEAYNRRRQLLAS